MAPIPGYRYDDATLPESPVSEDELIALAAGVLLEDADRVALREAGEVLADHVEEILDVWYGFVAGLPQLVAHFADQQGRPIGAYLAEVRPRFGQWILDSCNRPYDRNWLRYQDEIARRHTRAGKNTTDGVRSTPYVPLRYLIALIYPICTTIRPFLAQSGAPPERVEAMHQAWSKSVILQVAIWSRAYTEQW